MVVLKLYTQPVNIENAPAFFSSHDLRYEVLLCGFDEDMGKGKEVILCQNLTRTETKAFEETFWYNFQHPTAQRATF